MSQIFQLNTENKHSFDRNSRQIGQIGEELAAEFLVKNAYRLVAANFKVPIGRNRLGTQVTGEIDLIAYDENILCFIEVKTRSSEEFASPLAAVDLRKQRQITRTARMYRKIFRLGNVEIRYDVVSIILHDSSYPKIEIIRNFWTESKFSKRLWSDDF